MNARFLVWLVGTGAVLLPGEHWAWFSLSSWMIPDPALLSFLIVMCSSAFCWNMQGGRTFCAALSSQVLWPVNSSHLGFTGLGSIFSNQGVHCDVPHGFSSLRHVENFQRRRQQHTQGSPYLLFIC